MNNFKKSQSRQGIDKNTRKKLWKTAFKKSEAISSVLASNTTSNDLKAVFDKFYFVRS